MPRGTVTVHAEGYGFVRTAEGEYFIPSAKLCGAFDGDVVEIAPLPASASKQHRRATASQGGFCGRPAARVVRVVERAHEVLVGRYEVADPFGVVIPEDPLIPYDIFTQRSANPDIPDGALVRVRISTYPSRKSAATGVVEEVLGAADACGVGVESIIARHKLPVRFSQRCKEEAASLSLDAEGALVRGYADLRSRCVFTIDPADARDFDDALSLEPASTEDSVPVDGRQRRPLCLEGRGWEGAGAVCWCLGVHIADVSAYVPWGSSIDFDARDRATSAYLVDRVIPMLPERLSNDLCSLRPAEERLTMTVDLFLDDQARIAAYRIYPAVIRSDVRLTYGQVQERLDGMHASEVGDGVPLAVHERLDPLARLAAKRASLRKAAGGIEFPSTEAKVRLDADGRPVSVALRRKTQATALVEEAMVLANEAVAHFLVEREIPGLFRVHERPAVDGLAALVPVFEEFAWFDKVDSTRFALGDPFAVQAALEASAGRSEGELVGQLLLRSMKRADYRPACEGHYGLASKAYAHFTSPIRRYPDLVVHRMLKAQLYGRPELYDQEVAALGWLGRHCSKREREADAAARETQELKLIELLEGHVGEAFSAVVSGVAPYGLYVRLDNTAEGVLPVRRLGSEYFSHDADLHRLVGEESGRIWRLGQRIAVVLIAADARRRQLEFRLAGEGGRA